MAKRKPIEPAWLLVPLLIIIFVFSAMTWLSTSDTYSSYTKTYTITGWEVLRLIHPSFWTWIWIGFGGMLVFGTLAYLNESGAWIGRHLKGHTSMTITFVILSLLSLIVPWIPALDAKANGGADLAPKSTVYENHYGTPGSVVYEYVYCSSWSTNGILLKRQCLTRSHQPRPVIQKNVAWCRWNNTYLGRSGYGKDVWNPLGNIDYGLHLVSI